MGTAPTEIVPEKPLLSQPQRIVNTLFDPGKTFTDLKRGTAWWMAWLLIAASAALFAYSVDKKVGFETAFDNAIQASPGAAARIERIPEADRARVMQGQVTGLKWRAYLAGLALLVISLIAAGLLMAIFNFGMGSSLSYKLTLSVVIYSNLPIVIKYLITSITLFAGRSPEGFLFDNPLASNLGYFVNQAAHPGIYTFGAFMDIFAIWSLFIRAIGFTKVAKVSLPGSLSAVFGLYLAFALLFAGVAAAFS